MEHLRRGISMSMHRYFCCKHVKRVIIGTNQLRCFGWRRLCTSSRNHSAVIVDGLSIAQEIKNEIKTEVKSLLGSGKRAPHLTVLLVGNDPASVVYVKNKRKAAEYTGITCDILRLPSTAEEKDVVKQISFLNENSDVDGILVQLPLPEHISERNICDAVLPQKDVDGFNVLNVGRFCVDDTAFIPATPSGVLEIIKRLNITTFGKNAVVCGRSKNVGLPIAIHLNSDGKGASCEGDTTTTVCHRNTPPEKLKFFTQQADILVTATGVPGLITADMVKDGVVVIDIGITRITDDKGKAKLVGDVDFQGVSQKASYITPVPGGVGPVTVAMVIKNTLTAYKKEINFDRHS
ncbi:bifunctional methylenetetrahydrofolate dehydrogenase/cyclohydrolase, mitochondrial [Aplysia californica]|uniref:methenyltetrahydrofolate cyclohydrolase n=1 Tax=Aplysia californica TaxID=6500 RepID=A0ABM1VNZ0_APLCA|nr:bifunctional methylenetetrahydrofolate dehydrogenase/cyclohydrolase, mitochondrial [Aplysia californica]XP_035824132.1 bifunctional methylenetetrahydrofolate dehydrogenase/cyclohydrolase, mitochondrial [Aplysia californica]XP_035824133.1 bifunctional methylenetetrahydrofolate dehydrogenase/cyclohydrolase, mitochondrial [Aplysia californica]